MSWVLQHKPCMCPDTFISQSLWITSEIYFEPTVSRTTSENHHLYLLQRIWNWGHETTMYICQMTANTENGRTSSQGKGRVNDTEADTCVCLSCPESEVWCHLCCVEGEFIAGVTEQCQVWGRQWAWGAGALSWIWGSTGDRRAPSRRRAKVGSHVTSVPSRSADLARAGWGPGRAWLPRWALGPDVKF